MQLNRILLTRVIQLVKASPNAVWIPELISEIGKRYEFTIVAQPQDPFRPEPDNKAEFKHGRLNADIIDTFTMFNDGFVVDTTTPTDHGELFLNHLMQWLKEKIPDLKEAGKPLYLSQIEVTLDLGKFASLLEPIGKMVFDLLKQYELPGARPFAFGTLQLAEDPLGKITPKPSVFGIERRRDIPFTDNTFFAQAPLKTPDHLFVLETLERTLANI